MRIGGIYNILERIRHSRLNRAVVVLRLRIQSCRMAWSGVMRMSGSHSKQRLIKSRNNASWHPMAFSKLRPFTRRLRPRLLVIWRGSFFESKNMRFLCALSVRLVGGMPSTSMKQAICSCSFSPGNSGSPLYTVG